LTKDTTTPSRMAFSKMTPQSNDIPDPGRISQYL